MSAKPANGTEGGVAGDFFYAGRELEAATELENYYRWIIALFRPYLGGHGVEYGSGIGTIAALLAPHLEHLDLVEPSPNLHAVLARRFDGDPRFTVVTEMLERHTMTMPDASRDTIVLVNVLEHIADDDRALAEFFRILRPGGHLLLFVPALSFLFSRLDELFGHYRRYHLTPLRHQVEAAGFEVVVARYMDMLGILPWWLINTIGGKRELDPGMTRLYDRVGIRVTRVLESLVPPPIGKNILLAARRPA